jgi:hypothetical protein
MYRIAELKERRSMSWRILHKDLFAGPGYVLRPRQTGRLTVGRNVTLSLNQLIR